ncbi:uncharacterized protein [Macrobrachium rosenbergii]|uniref:uncharacterized protein n=1 Tax=Macrobrachium rosenbergii TaxID=79674 RepID=UPI0034D5796F
MGRFKWHILLFTLLWITDISESALGQKCTGSGSCSYPKTLLEEQVCDDGVCRCNPEIEVLYSSDLAPTCGRILQHLGLSFSDCKRGENCSENEECVQKTVFSALGDDKGHICLCKAGFLRINSACREVSHQRVLESCYIPNNGSAIKSCDINKNSICKKRKCVCFDSFFANTTSGNCEPKADYIAAHNLTEYRVKPYEYCNSNSDCIEGLECHDFKCDCPEPCYYNRTAEICDCGAVELPPREGVVGPAIVGVLLGLIVVAFWYCMIKRTIRKYTKKEDASHTEVSATEETPNNYALQPVSPPNEIRGSETPLEVTDLSGNPEKQSFLPDGDARSGENAGVSPPPPPQASLYGFGIPQGASAFPPIGPVAPPPYLPLPSANEPPPPYSVNPQEGSVIAPIPDSSIPTALPYPYNATTPAPFTASPANPTGSDGATPPALNPSTALPYPVSPGISDSVPTAPSAPSYELDSSSASLPKKV